LDDRDLQVQAPVLRDHLLKFNNEEKTDICLDINDADNRINDADGALIMQCVSGCSNTTEFQAPDRLRRDQFIRELRFKGLSIRQITRLTGISFGIVRKQ